MDVVKNAVEHVNPGQTPVVTLDQSLFALAKQIQWKWPEKYGEDKMVGGDVRWAPHRDGRPEDARRLAARKWLGTSRGAS